MFTTNKPVRLKSPQKNFGSTPDSGEMYTYIVIFGVISYLLPLFIFPLLGWQVSNNGNLTSGVMIAMILVFCSIVALIGKKLWHSSIRMHYLMNYLVPFLEEKYNIYLYRRTIRDVIRGKTLKLDNEGNPIVFVDWKIIEEEAKSNMGKDLTNEVFLMVRSKDGSYRELLPRNK